MKQQRMRRSEVLARETVELRDVRRREDWGRRVVEGANLSLREGRREGVAECVPGLERLNEGILCSMEI